MTPTNVTDRDRARAQRCVECLVCKRARDKQAGPFFWFVKLLERGVCPYCAAYERVYGRKAHEGEPKRSPTSTTPRSSSGRRMGG